MKNLIKSLAFLAALMTATSAEASTYGLYSATMNLATSTTPQTILTAGSNGSRIYNARAYTNATSNINMVFTVLHGASSFTMFYGSIAPGSGGSGNQSYPPLDVFTANPDSTYTTGVLKTWLTDSLGFNYISLAPGDSLQVAPASGLTGSNVLTVNVEAINQ